MRFKDFLYTTDWLETALTVNQPIDRMPPSYNLVTSDPDEVIQKGEPARLLPANYKYKKTK